MPLLRFIIMALLAGTAALLPVARAHAEPLDRESCLKLKAEQSKLLTREMKVALERGPDWVKDHLNTGEIEKVREFLAVEEMIEFRCRGGGVVKKEEATAGPPSLPDRKPDAPQPATAAAEGADVPLPDRNPRSVPPPVADVEPSQALADSVKTAPAKTKATR